MSSEPWRCDIGELTLNLAPEIIKGERFSFPVDCWALGVTFYVILGGYKPFDNPEKPSDPSLNQQILTGKVVFHEGTLISIEKSEISL